MAAFDDLAELIETAPYQTNHRPDLSSDDESTRIPVELVTGAIEDKQAALNLLPGAIDIDDPDVEGPSGTFTSSYGSSEELTAVRIIEQPDEPIWMHVFRYTNLDDYNAGLSIIGMV